MNFEMPSAEKIQLIVASLAFFFIGQFGARFYETHKVEGSYNKAAYLRLVQYVIGLAPLIFVALHFVYNYASGYDKSHGENHMMVYILYACLGALGIGSCAMILSDVNKSNFTADETTDLATDESQTASIANGLAIFGIVLFSLHLIASIVLAVTKNTADIFSLNAFKTAIPASLMAKFNKSETSSSVTAPPAPTNAFGMDDLLGFGKRRKRYLH